MRLLTLGPSPARTGPQLDLAAPAARIDAVGLLTGYLFLLMAIPSALVVGSFGAAGAPAALFGAILFCWYVAARQHPAMALDRGQQPVRVAAVLFGCVIIAAYISVSRTAMPSLQVNGANRGVISLAGWLGVLLLAADGIDGMSRLGTLLRRIVIGATAMAVTGIVEFFTRLNFAQYITIPGLSVQPQVTDLLTRDGLVRVMATAGEPLEFSAVLAMSLPLAIHQARFAPPALRKRRWLQVGVIAATMPLSGSRAAIFGLAVTCVVLIPTWSKRDRHRAYLALAAAPGLVWLAEPRLLTDFVGLFSHLGTDASSQSRTRAYSEAAPFIGQHPWLGAGFGTFFPQTYFFIDNQYLTSLVETGVVGLVALVALFATGWLAARSARLATVDAQTRDLAQCLAASVAVAAVCFVTFDALSFSIAAGLCFLLLGCVGALWRLTRGSPAG